MKNSLYIWLFWACYIQILISIKAHFASSICLEDERSLLLQLRSNLNYSRSKSSKLAYWNQTLDCCQWNGIQCDRSAGHVIGIDLSGESITSSSDSLSSLFSLQFLQSLNLANNSFSNADISSEFGKLASLTYLNLSNAGFSGQVPREISQLTKLVTLDLSSLSYLGSSPLKLENPSLAMLIRNFTGLRGLNLNGVVISVNGSEWCKALSSAVPNLKFLSLSNCNLSGGISASLGKLQSLSELSLDQNNLAAPVPAFIAKFGNLTALKLSNCQLRGRFPQSILKLPRLRSLDLSSNQQLQGALPEFPSNSSLQMLIVSYTNFSGKLPNSMGNLQQLQRIEIVNCSFSGSIPPSMGQLKQLMYVDFSNNKFSGLVPSLSSAKSLSNLRLSNNMLNGTVACTQWISLSKLVDLDLNSNSLNGNIPGSLFSLPSLQSIQLYQNEFTGALGELNISSPIQTLDLSFNKLWGEIPDSVFKMQGLKVLKLSYNRFNGLVDIHLIEKLKDLSVLELSFNRLEVYAGTTSKNLSSYPQLRSLRLASCTLHILPAFLKWQSNLTSLDLSDNQIQGRIPRWIWEVDSLSYLNLSRNNFIELEPPFRDPTSLSVLDLNSNKIQGVIPKPPSKIQYLDYSNNSFTSIIPTNISDFLGFTILFSLSRNNLSGNIPASFCKLANLQVLDLSDNQLNGTIPNCLIEMTSTLGVLNLGRNKLRGPISNTFPGNCSLRTLGVNANNLEGSIPRSLANCTQLQVLDLGNNEFNDTFPEWLNTLWNIRVLVLRSNNLYGSIQCAANDLSWKMLQIIDLAFNNFSGEFVGHCVLKFKGMITEEDQFDTTSLKYNVYDSYFYEDMVSVTLKGSEYQLQKILRLFTTIDFSSNNFKGKIPKVIGNLYALKALNLSHNKFSGSIPSSLGNLTMLEALDLSHNQLTGEIPPQLTSLTFLSFLNFSYNKLKGRIPAANQFWTFDASSYINNQGLYGPPLTKSTSLSPSSPSKRSSAQQRKSSSEGKLDWLSIFIGSGFGTGAALVIAPLMFWKKGRKWFDKRVNKIVSTILLACGIDHVTFDQGNPQPEEDIKHQLFDITGYSEVEAEEESIYGRFCVFCSKLDIDRKRVIHNPGCTCHGFPSSILSSFSLSSSK
ncbi:Receptor-like protein 6 [Bienertia sinuspersici]